jgi:hypothetical protein
MLRQTDAHAEQPQPNQKRHFLTRAEMATLLGMLLVMSSLFFTWERQTFSPSQALPPNALFVSLTSLSRSGFGTSVRWPLTVCSILCALLLLWPPTPQNRLPMAVAQGACGIACLVIALSKLALLPGVLLGLIGGALLTFGAVDRFTYAYPEEPTTKG